MRTDDKKTRAGLKERLQQVAEVLVHSRSGSLATEPADRSLVAGIVGQRFAGKRPRLDSEGPHHLEPLRRRG
jgi:hypothetical protein